MTVQFRISPVALIDPLRLYDLLRLRVDVFVVEQECAYPELDGRDVEPDAVMLWAEEDEQVLATVRLLVDHADDTGAAAAADALRIGRVATAPAARGRGLAADLMRLALDRAEGRLVRLDAQAHLEGWYARFGFVVDGPGFLEDGIPHVPMSRAATER
ncbi:GNAT family N-acetyltransferase [Frigoribacterium sp. ACAM 257]|uniref:GNAT family N-acetyltransferase n=1 Tax=Frigoribacterium sp. ACAM 257 TaxID=2508998 RepID=UPI0011B9BBD4|nr:GNAT family N-acetyltransferase [Frigoribacterium sp. ACAM 257]TWX40090.1 GNAT family N-acetyltransferase [Frigoribacterium sp. ACAM 257]